MPGTWVSAFWISPWTKDETLNKIKRSRAALEHGTYFRFLILKLSVSDLLTLHCKKVNIWDYTFTLKLLQFLVNWDLNFENLEALRFILITWFGSGLFLTHSAFYEFENFDRFSNSKQLQLYHSGQNLGRGQTFFVGKKVIIKTVLVNLSFGWHQFQMY